MLWGCTGLRKLPDEEYLFTGATIHYDSAELLTKKSEANTQLEALIKAPNMKLLWMRPLLSIHNSIKEPKKEKGLGYWLKYKIGEPPILLRDFDLPQIDAAMINRLENLGHFDAELSYDVETSKNTASLSYIVSPKPLYELNEISFPAGDKPLDKQIHKTKSKSLLKTGNPYNLSSLKNERNRIAKVLKDKGYFYFSSDYILFIADSALGAKQINLEMEVKPEIPLVSKTAFYLDKVYVYDDFSLKNYKPDTTIINNLYYVSSKHIFNPGTITDAVFLRSDSLYSRQNHYNTLSYMMGLGVYKFANARFNISDTLKGKMDVGIYLTPQKKMSVGAEISASIKTNNYAGPGLNLSFKNRNTFRGAELFSLTLGGRFETQYSGEFQGETSYEVTLDGALTFPRFVPIRFNRNQSRKYVPKTTIGMGFGLFSRVRYYELHSFNVTMAYSWQSSQRISQTFTPIDINFTNLVKSSDAFQEYLDENPSIKKSFEEQFIIGGGYNITYSNMYLQKNRTNFFISQGFDVSGNLANVLTTASTGSKPSPEDQQLIFGVPYSQFIRLRNEMRFFLRIGKKKKDQIGVRTIAAAAFPYGNSATIPYVKQFFVGGTNSVRAFQARTVGPGSYAPPDSISNLYVDQSGDIKLEASLEYRFPILKYLKGAFFVDAGNIWLVNKDPQRPGGEFDSKTFYKDFAVGSGLGLRIDFTFVVIRFDMAFPLRKPSLPEGERWVLDNVQLGSSSWRKDNLIMNIAIGYPF